MKNLQSKKTRKSFGGKIAAAKPGYFGWRIFSLVLVFAWTAFAPLAFGAGEVKLSDFTSDQPAILPNNPFYAIKSGFQRFFAGSKIFDLLELADQRAAEVFTSYSVGSKDPKLMQKALEAYLASAQNLKNRLSELDHKEASEDSIKNQLFARLDKAFVTHVRFTHDLELVIKNAKQADLVKKIREEFFSALAVSSGSLQPIEDFNSRILALAESQNAAVKARVAQSISDWLMYLVFAKQEARLIEEVRDLESDLAVLLQEDLQKVLKDGGEEKLYEVLNAGPVRLRVFSLAYLAELNKALGLKNHINFARLGAEAQLNIGKTEFLRAFAYAKNYQESVFGSDEEASSPAEERAEFYAAQMNEFAKRDNFNPGYLQAALLSAVSAANR